MNDTTKHTAGPWTAFQRESEVGSNYWRILLHGHPDKQNVHGQDSLIGYCGEANARLIASSPRLLAALQEMVRYHTPGAWIDTSGPAYKELNEARAAIAQALGTDG